MQILKTRKNKIKKSNFWYTNFDTVTKTKHQELVKLIEDKKNPPDVIAFVEAKLKNSKTEWNTAWYKFENHDIDSKT